MNPIKLSLLCILIFSFVSPADWAAEMQNPKPNKTLQEWQRDWSKFEQHINESRKIDGGGIQDLMNGSLELMLALADGPVASSKLTDAAKRTGFGEEVEFTSVFEGIEACSDKQKKIHGTTVTLKFKPPFRGYFFSVPNEAEESKWKALSPGSNVRWRSTVSAIAVWFVRPDTEVNIITLTNARIIQ